LRQRGEPFTAVDRLSCDDLSPAQFIASYERPGLPCVIADVPARERWPACHRWTLDRLTQECLAPRPPRRTDHSNVRCATGHLGERYFKVGEDDDGYKVKVRLRYFLRYLRRNADDSPLYIFDRYD